MNEVERIKKEATEEIKELEKELDMKEKRVKASLRNENEIVREYLLMIHGKSDKEQIKELTKKIAGKLKDMDIFPEKEVK